jgi:nucleoid DNA-binding protein
MTEDYKLTKKKLSEIVSYKTGISQKDSKKLTSVFLKTLKKSLINGERIELRGFGIFEKLKSKKKFARDMKTNRLKLINKKYRLKFSPSEVIIKKINK